MLTLPRWATDCLKRADPALASLARPLVLWERIRGGLRIAALDLAASQRGLRPGQSLADARALVPDLEMREIDRVFLEQVFADFADWHSNASPIVSVLTDTAAFGDLGLDIAGVAHLFGGEQKMLETLVARLQRLGYTTQGGVASTLGAAWAMAQYRPGTIIARGAEQAALADLPVAALRLEDEQVEGLIQMGLKRIGQLWSRDRKALVARFGQSLSTRLDQASGALAERPVPRVPVSEHYTERRFAEPIVQLDDVHMSAHDLAIQLGLRLEEEGLGAQSFHLFLYRVDHRLLTLSVNAARATRDPDHVSRLFEHRSERLVAEYDAGFGIDMIRLAATSLSPLGSTQLGVFETDDGAADLDRLYDRMASRLGPLAVVRQKFVDTHIPERAVRLEPMVARTPDEPAAAPNPALPRPLRLLPRPESITVMAEVPDGPPVRMVWRRLAYRFARASGPERIESEWWRSGQRLGFLLPDVGEPDATLTNLIPEHVMRDYYIAEDETGRRFWLFRQGLYGYDRPPDWFLHGLFA